MEDKPAYIVSDIHLGSVPDSTERQFRQFLRHVAENASELLINGDLFDFWFEYRSVIQGEHFRVLAALADVREAGVPIRFLGGNHDAWGGAFLRDRIGIEILTEGQTVPFGRWRALVVHGDGVGRGDIGYRILKKVIRNRVSTRLFRSLHPDFGGRVAAMVSTTDRKHGTPDHASPARARELRDWAADRLRERPDIDLVLAGHTHTPAVEEIVPGKFYVNSGDWINHFTYVVLPNEGPPALRDWVRS